MEPLANSSLYPSKSISNSLNSESDSSDESDVSDSSTYG